ncbi:hypothetical protein SASPL_111290 [Salvia splendens]|uniref:Dilute domain-containing protein n=1 Tax=Salvia splendens TaxID=180675 RepID=A0A8X8YC73_SALSN|nr:hypothetical protein SASPL_111290 [Salvia splendens]
MKETDRRKGLNNKEKTRLARPETRDRKLPGKNAGRNLKEREVEAKPSSDKQNRNLGSDLKSGVEPSESFENVVIDYVDDECRSEESLHSTRNLKTDERRGNEKLSDISSDMDIVDESDAETTNDSVSSQGDPQTADEGKAEKVTRVRNLSSGSAQAHRLKSDRGANNLQTKASKQTPRKGPENGLLKSAKSSSDSLKNMKVHPKALSDSSEGADSQPLEQNNGVDPLDEASSGALTVCSDDEAVNTEENRMREDNIDQDQKIEEMETRIKNLESELREVAALEIALYSVVPEHGSSAHKVHTPARRLSRLYIYACKHWSQDRRATVARNTVSGLVLVSKSCGNDVSRLTFWLSNTVVLREIISHAFGSSCQSNASAKLFESNGGDTKSSTNKWKNSGGNRQLNKKGFLQFVDDWQETRTFTAALEKVESWIFSRIVESIWWQTLTPNMQSPVDDSTTLKGLDRMLSEDFALFELGDMSVVACQFWLGRLDVAMFNAILRESAHEIPTDPVSDPIVDSKVLPIPAGDLSFGSGAQLKNSVGNWGRWLSDFLGMDTDSSAQDVNATLENDDKQGTDKPKSFPLLNALSDLLMLPKDMLMDHTIRMEVCPEISLPLVKRVLCNFSPDEFCPDPVPGSVLEALNAEISIKPSEIIPSFLSIIERRISGESATSFPYTAAPTVYTPPSSSDVAEKVAEAGASTKFYRSASSVQRKGYTSDEELDEMESCLSSVVDTLPPSPTAVRGNGKGSGSEVGGDDGANARYDLLREVWQSA